MRALTILFAAFALLAGLPENSFAADKGGPKGPLDDLIPQASEKSPWAGCYVGAGVGHRAAQVSGGGGPVGPGSDGYDLAPIVGCDLQAGALVGGISATYSFLQGDLKTLGIEHELAITGRAGFVVTPSTLIYGHVSWARLDTSFGDIDGWKVGPGIEVMIPKSAFSLDFRYSYGTWDVSHIQSGIDANSHEVMVFGKYRFGK